MTSKESHFHHTRWISPFRVTLSKGALFLAGLTFSFMAGCQLDSSGEDLERGGEEERADDERLLEGEALSWETQVDLETEGAVMNVWGTTWTAGWSRDQVWAVGGQPDRGRLWAHSAEGWAEETEVPEGELLNWIHGADGHLWIVGNGGRALRQVDGGAWETFNADTDQDLWGVWVASPTEVWAVGGNAVGEGTPAPILTHFDGRVWSQVQVPELDRGGVRALFKIWGDGRGTVFAVGMKGVIIGDIGDGWRQFEVSSYGDGPTSADDLISLWGGGGEIVAVGGRSNGVLARWDGQQWRSTVLAGTPGLNGVWVDDRGAAVAVGVRGAVMRFDPLSFEGRRERSDTTFVLHSTWGDQGRVWAVGGTLDNTPPWAGVILSGEGESL
jgi:hypothetical protein